MIIAERGAPPKARLSSPPLEKVKNKRAFFAVRYTCSNQAHFLSPELIGVWKCVLLFRGDFALIVRGLSNEPMKSYRNSGKNRGNITIKRKIDLGK